MTDRLTDKYTLEEIYELSEIQYYDEDIKMILKSIIKELYHAKEELLIKLRLKHIDRAISKYRRAKEKTSIHNSRQYFKSCLLSAILEIHLDELEPFD